MATTDVCDGFNAKQDEAVNFTNSSGMCCQLKQDSTEWPFTDPSPLCVPVTGKQTKIKSKADLPNGTYLYTTSCCPDDIPKSVTVP